MHLDHAGGLDQFMHRKDVEIWVHDKELRSAFWSVATGADEGVYLKHYLDVCIPLGNYHIEDTTDCCSGIIELENVRRSYHRFLPGRFTPPPPRTHRWTYWDAT